MQERNRDMQNKQGSNESNETKIHLTPDSTLQTPEEDRRDKSIDPRRNNTFEVSSDDLRETDMGRFRKDTTGTSEREDDQPGSA